MGGEKELTEDHLCMQAWLLDKEDLQEKGRKKVDFTVNWLSPSVSESHSGTFRVISGLLVGQLFVCFAILLFRSSPANNSSNGFSMRSAVLSAFYMATMT